MVASVTELVFGTWNVRLLMDTPHSYRPERRTVIVARELGRANIDICALSETRLADEGVLCEQKGAYTFFWRGKPKSERRIHGVGLAVRNDIINKLPETPLGTNERLMSLGIKLSGHQSCTIISAYAPTLEEGTWVTYQRHIKSLEQYHQRCLRRILGVKWQDKRTNNSILLEAETLSIESIIAGHRLRWPGHVVRMSDHRLPKLSLASVNMKNVLVEVRGSD